MTSSRRGATALGLLAILFWSTSVGVTRSATEALGPAGAPAVLFSISALLMLPTRTPWAQVPRRYLWLGGALFVAYQLCFVLALGFAGSRTEAIEVGMVNYLWPSLTVLCATLAERQRPGVPMLLGLGLAAAGLLVAMSPADGVSLGRLLQNAAGNPLSYGLALAAALVWALYSTCTRHLAQGRNALWYLMAATACAFWLLFAVQAGVQASPMQWQLSPGLLMLVAAASTATALAYSFWNHGVMHGHLPLLALAANGTPLLAAGFASLLLRAPLPLIFWIGVMLVAAGSALAGWGARRGAAK